MTGWERLITARDAAERVAVRRVLIAAIKQHAERTDQLLVTLEHVVRNGVAKALGG